MAVEMEHKLQEEENPEIFNEFNQSPIIFGSSCQSLELPVSSSDNLTFTKSQLRSDEEHVLEKGFHKPLRLAFLLVALSVSTICSILLGIFWTGRHEAPFDVSQSTFNSILLMHEFFVFLFIAPPALLDFYL